MSLFSIVKSMSIAEKRHFKLYVNRNGKSKSLKYVELFDLINSQTASDKGAIKKEGFIASDKFLLHEKIEESLHVQYLGKTVDSKLKWLLESMQRLFKRELWQELSKCIQKTKQLAKKHERFLDALQALQWEKRLFARISNSKRNYERYEKLIQEEMELRVKIEEELNYENLKLQIMMLRIKDVELNESENRKKFEQIVSSPLLKIEEAPYSIKAKTAYFQSRAVAFRYQNKYNKAYTQAQTLIQLYEANKSFMLDNPIWYISSLCLLAEICYVMGKYDKIPEIIDKIEQIEDDSLIGFKMVCMYGLLYAIIKIDRNKGEQYISKINMIIEDEHQNIRDGKKLALMYNIFVFYFILEDWQKTKVWLTKIFQFKRTDDRRDLQYAVRLISLVSCFELDLHNLEGQIKAVAKYLKANKLYTTTNKYILQSFRNLYKAINKKACLPIWHDLSNYLSEKRKTEQKTHIQLGLDEIYFWCLAKINNTTIEDVIKAHSE